MMCEERGESRSSLPLTPAALFWRKPLTHEIPVPRIAPNTGTGILQRFELQPAFRQTHHPPVFDQSRSVGRYEMRHLTALPHVTVEPQPAIHRVYHPVATLLELDVISRQCWPSHAAPWRAFTGRPPRRRSSPAVARRCRRRCSSEWGSPCSARPGRSSLAQSRHRS